MIVPFLRSMEESVGRSGAVRCGYRILTGWKAKRIGRTHAQHPPRDPAPPARLGYSADLPFTTTCEKDPMPGPRSSSSPGT